MSFNTGVRACSIMLDFSEIFARQFFIFHWVGFNLVFKLRIDPSSPLISPPPMSVESVSIPPHRPLPLPCVFIESGSIPPHRPLPFLVSIESVHARSCPVFQKILLDNFSFFADRVSTWL